MLYSESSSILPKKIIKKQSSHKTLRRSTTDLIDESSNENNISKASKVSKGSKESGQMSKQSSNKKPAKRLGTIDVTNRNAPLEELKDIWEIF